MPSLQAARRITISTTRHVHNTTFTPRSALSRCYSSTGDSTSKKQQDETLIATVKPSEIQKPTKKTQAELDRELQLKMQGLAGDGGESGVEYEDGQPVSMKRSVKNNMFRYI
ncbi:hypothetical protein BU26DRAFT_557206 [Trematosphaeria pertusa]|uniref:Uncharacterized protein n=1 Tax=Trematosphaeria pertusa TaxID=390896 RepID=A0A6A6J1D8_9PLEO|nr:uncharacterized protein BU26DRAFT_557206 [Trematosphaeria pertusa]KAF2255700.1 hypothetical protein BU26DRAFT_557206 [Trematosphaeria pertusa]